MRENIPAVEFDPSSLPSGALTHGAAVGAFFATAMGYLPALLAVIPAIYYLLLIYESKTVQSWVEARRERRKIINLAKAQAAAKVSTAKTEAAALVATVAAKVAVDDAKK